MSLLRPEEPVTKCFASIRYLGLTHALDGLGWMELYEEKGNQFFHDTKVRLGFMVMMSSNIDMIRLKQ